MCAHHQQGFTGSPDHQKREEFIISKSWEAKGNNQFVYYIEMACNGYVYVLETDSIITQLIIFYSFFKN